MGTDVYIDGELTIPESKVLEAGTLLLEAIGHQDELAPEYLPPDYHQKILTPDGILGLLNERMTAFEVELRPAFGLVFGVDDCTRREDEDQWVFKALAPAFDNGELYMSADDYKWMWVIENGEFREVNAETVYDHDENAVPTIEKLVALIYPAALGGRPITAVPPEERLPESDDSDALFLIENLLRMNGYGPQAGMSELDRLAEV